MNSKPFPSPYRVGIDICSINRIQSLVDRYRGDNLLTWGSKIFHRLEWPYFLSKTDEYGQSIGLEASKTYVHWLAGRWAAKEAALKAHAKRKLYMRDVILLPPLNSSKQTTPISGKAIALIDPPRRTVLMSEEVARQRGLGKKQNSSSFQNIGTDVTPGTSSWVRWSDPSEPVIQLPEQKVFIRKDEVRSRKLLIADKERQMVDISISHDTDYAVAVCMAVDDLEEQDLKALTDTGSGDAIHEPEWGDRGFLVATATRNTDS